MRILIIAILTLIPPPSHAAQPGFVEPYLEIQSLLAKDSIAGIEIPARTLENALQKDHQPSAEKAAHALRSAKTIAEAREQFLLISKTLLPWARKNRIMGLILAYCPMKPGYWLQKAGDLRNPYYGAEMLECGVIQKQGK